MKKRNMTISDMKTWLRSDPAFMAAFRARRGNSFAASVCRQLWNKGSLSDKQMDALKRFGAGRVKFNALKEEQAELMKNAPPLKHGRYRVKGTVVSFGERSTRFGLVMKMLVQSATGNKIWGTVPKEIKGQIDKGLKVSFEATVVKSDKDEHFGFYSRPSKAFVIEE